MKRLLAVSTAALLAMSGAAFADCHDRNLDAAGAAIGTGSPTGEDNQIAKDGSLAPLQTPGDAAASGQPADGEASGATTSAQAPVDNTTSGTAQPNVTADNGQPNPAAGADANAQANSNAQANAGATGATGAPETTGSVTKDGTTAPLEGAGQASPPVATSDQDVAAQQQGGSTATECN